MNLHVRDTGLAICPNMEVQGFLGYLVGVLIIRGSYYWGVYDGLLIIVNRHIRVVFDSFRGLTIAVYPYVLRTLKNSNTGTLILGKYTMAQRGMVD